MAGAHVLVIRRPSASGWQGRSPSLAGSPTVVSAPACALCLTWVEAEWNWWDDTGRRWLPLCGGHWGQVKVKDTRPATPLHPKPLPPEEVPPPPMPQLRGAYPYPRYPPPHPLPPMPQ